MRPPLLWQRGATDPASRFAGPYTAKLEYDVVLRPDAAGRAAYSDQMTAPYRLHYAPDNASLIVRLALEELGVPYETALVDRSVQAQKSPAYLALNPNGLIPVLETPRGPIFETGAILLWLADTHARLAPVVQAPARAAFLKWLFFVSGTLHGDMRMIFYPSEYVGQDTGAQAVFGRTLRNRIRAHLEKLDDAAAMEPGWLGASEPTILDFYLACLMRWMALYPKGSDRDWFQLYDTPHLRRMLTALETRPSVGAARQAEGLGPTPFSSPTYANPPEGSAT